MENLRLIHDFADGTLNPAQEEQLFQMLASNDEYRNELKQQLAIKSAVKNDASAYTPSAKSTLKVFSALGFAAPIAGSAGAGQAAAATNSSVSTGASVTKAGFWSNLSTPIITGVVSTVATAVVAILLFQPFLSNMDSKINNLQKQNQVLSKQIDNNNLNNIPVVTSQETDNKQTSTKMNSQKPIIKYVYISKDNKANVNKTELIDSPRTTDENSNINLSLANIVTSNVDGVFTDDSYIPDEYKFVPDIEFPNLYIRDNIGLNLEVNRLINWFDQAPTINPANYNKMNNTAITLFYQVSNDFYLGAEYRQETFFQTFKGVDSKGQAFEYQQQPNFTSGGIVARYAPNELKFYGLVPYAQLYGGVTNVGYIGRAMIGLKYSPYPNISFVVSGERSQLYYKYQNASFNGGKYDINYGVSFNF